MNSSDRQKKSKWHSIILNDNWCCMTSSLILIVWITWLVQIISGINLFDSKDESTPLNATFQIALVNTVICSPITIYRYLRIRGVMLHGIDTPYRVISTGIIKYAGYRDIWIEYDFNHKSYKKKISIYAPQDELSFRLLVNAKKPKHIAILD